MESEYRFYSIQQISCQESLQEIWIRRTIQWIVRKPFGRRGERGLYNIPEIKELHDLWECSVINTTIKTYNGQEFPIKRANNKDFQ